MRANRAGSDMPIARHESRCRAPVDVMGGRSRPGAPTMPAARTRLRLFDPGALAARGPKHAAALPDLRAISAAVVPTR